MDLKESVKKVLIVDDEPLIVMDHQGFFEDLGIEVVTAFNGQDALDHLDNSIDLIVTDFHMPHMNGRELFDTIRGEEDKRPFVMVSGQSKSERAEHEALFRADGNAVFMNKPFSERNFLEAIKTLTPVDSQQGFEIPAYE